jgi:mono/diheme cytochrome c family protein
LTKANLLSILGLFAIIAAFPVYMAQEPQRLQVAQDKLREKELVEATDLYVDYCLSCHGLAGEGLDNMPALNNPAMADANARALFNKIAHAPHNSAMAAWHIEEGGILNTYQVNKLVTLIRFGDWYKVGMIAANRNIPVPSGPNPDMATIFLEELEDKDHQCVACHEEPQMHTGLFGIQCARCHTIDAWAPAYLTLHTFILDHGENVTKNCETCHPKNYPEYTCYGCHDHVEEEMVAIHLDEQITDIANCAMCHPTGVEGEAGRLRELQVDPQLLEKKPIQ